jgi:hypothetical protein
MRSHLTAAVAAPPADVRDVAEMKAWARRAYWADQVTPRQRVRALVDLALTPWRSTTEIARVFREYGRFVEQRFGVPRYRQLPSLVRARIRHGLDPIAYYRFELYRPERWKRASQYVQTGDTGRILRWLVAKTPGYPRVFGDKRRFEDWCVEHDLRSVRALMEFDAGKVVRATPDGTLPAFDLFSKPANWQGGQGAQSWIYAGDGTYVGSDGKPRDAAALVEELARFSSEIGRPILLQRLLRTAASIADLTPGALCTARIGTLRHPNGDHQLLHAIYRMPTGTASADNFYLGGLAATIDPETGRLSAAIRKDPRLTPEPYTRHPDTGGLVEGRQLPHWKATADLALRAHAAIGWKGVPVIGWDVAILDDGPILIEGNNVPCSTLAQMVTGPLGDTAFVSCVNAHLRERFAAADRH